MWIRDTKISTRFKKGPQIGRIYADYLRDLKRSADYADCAINGDTDYGTRVLRAARVNAARVRGLMLPEYVCNGSIRAYANADSGKGFKKSPLVTLILLIMPGIICGP
jgi:hypothetical protein